MAMPRQEAVAHGQPRTDDRRSRRGGGGITGQRQRSGQHRCCYRFAEQSRLGTAEEVPGIATLNRGEDADMLSVSCGAAGNCSAGGFYTPRFGRRQAFVVSQTGGTWRPAIEVPGTAALNQGGSAGITSLSCAPAGNCSAGGHYIDSSRSIQQVFVVSET